LLDRFEGYKKIVYDKSSNEIFINNWVKYNKIVSPKVKKCVEKELKEIKSQTLINLFLNECNKYGYSIDTPIQKVDNYLNTVSIPMTKTESNLDNHYGEEKEKQKEKEEEKYINKDVGMDMCIKEDVSKYAKLYEQNIGLINGIVAEWLIEISETIDIRLFKRAIEIATDNGRCNKGYVNGIIKQWIEKNIKTFEDLKAYEIGKLNQGGNENGAPINEHEKSKYQRDANSEDSNIYRKPTEEELREIREFIEGEN
ncbi:DnaD domain protein, partial [Paraclostridium bifermentans]|uniref:DnaD domain protein n=1 Tax=Paraclostridium bifermentans TaxID=1490 RepID=UPI001A9AF319